mgnify:CR=1 FL=1
MVDQLERDRAAQGFLGECFRTGLAELFADLRQNGANQSGEAFLADALGARQSGFRRRPGQ